MTEDPRPENSDIAPKISSAGKPQRAVEIEEPPPGVHAMALFRWILVASMALIAALSVTYSFGLVPGDSAGALSLQYYCPMHPQVVQDHPGECPICSMTLVKKEGSSKSTGTTRAGSQDGDEGAAATPHEGHRHNPADAYHCPMHPEETGADAGARCPICGMKFEKRAESHSNPVPPMSAPPAPPTPDTRAEVGASTPEGVPGLVPLELALDRVQTIGVRTAVALREDLAPELRAVGFVSADEARLARVHARFSGWIERLAVPVTGQKVSRGQVLASIYNLELLPAQREYLAARRWSSAGAESARNSNGPVNGGSLEQDARERLELFGMSAAEIEKIEESGEPTRTVAVTAPIGGYVVAKGAVQGAYVQPGTELFEIADLSRVWVLADIYEYEVERVKLGQVAEVQLAAYPSERFSGKVG